MKVKLRILSGSKQGTEFVSSKPLITLGRHPSSDFQFDPQEDLDVSANHARIVLRDGAWHVEDAGSSNGTLVNGYIIKSTTKLEDTDQIRFGAEGPNAEFRVVKDSVEDGTTGSTPVQSTAVNRPTHEAPPRPTVQPDAPTPTPPPASSPTQRIRIEVEKQTQGLRRLTIGLFVALIGVAATFFTLEMLRQKDRVAEIAATRARVDSILTASARSVEDLRGQMQGMADELTRSRNDVQRLQQSLEDAQLAGDPALIASLQNQLTQAASALNAQRAAAQVDFNAVWEVNQRAVAMVWVEFGPGEIFTGTAFAVRPDGTMLTNRHVVAGASGDRVPRRIAVKFADSRQVFRASVLAVSSEADLAVIRVAVAGTVPTVQALAGDAQRARTGEPAAVIGFPLGTELPMSGEGSDQVARTTLTVGTVSKSLEQELQLDAWGAEGSSGSPIFNGEGTVIGILWGGQEGSGGKVIFAAPASFAHSLLATVN